MNSGSTTDFALGSNLGVVMDHTLSDMSAGEDRNLMDADDFCVLTDTKSLHNQAGHLVSVPSASC